MQTIREDQIGRVRQPRQTIGDVNRHNISRGSKENTPSTQGGKMQTIRNDSGPKMAEAWRKWFLLLGLAAGVPGCGR